MAPRYLSHLFGLTPPLTAGADPVLRTKGNIKHSANKNVWFLLSCSLTRTEPPEMSGFLMHIIKPE